MNELFGTVTRSSAEFLSSKIRRRVLFLVILSIVALAEFFTLGLARRTFVFYTVNDGGIVVEDRMLKRSSLREDDVIRYVEETLLGPSAHDLLPLFPGGTRLKTLLYRDGVVFANLSQDAALPPVEEESALIGFRTLHDGIKRNFASVKEVRFFIEGNAAFAEEFRSGVW